jgi:adenosine deaminase
LNATTLDASDRIFFEKLCKGEDARDLARWETVLTRVSAAPKAELHCHLAGSMRPETLKHLAQSTPDLNWDICAERFGPSIGNVIAHGVMGEVKRYLEYRVERGSLADYMRAYALPKTVLATEYGIRTVAFEVCEDNYREGVRYLEIRFNPWMLDESIALLDHIKSIARGIGEARRKYPDLEVALLLSLVKDHDLSLVTRILEESIEANRDPSVDGLIAGVDSAGNEIGFHPPRYAEIFARARDAGLAIVCHAGEAYESLEDGVRFIEESVDILGARRIGHGLAAGLDAAALVGKNDAHGRPYDGKRIDAILERQQRLRNRLREKNILVEVCPSSKLHTGSVGSIEEHPVGLFMQEGVPVAICTDNRWVSHTRLSWEIVRIAKSFGLDGDSVDKIIRAPFEYKLGNLR